MLVSVSGGEAMPLNLFGESTGKKLARTADLGRLSASLPRPAGERPRVLGELSLALFSNSDRRLRTADDDRSSEGVIS